MSYWWNGSGGGWNGSSWGGSGDYSYMDGGGYSSSVEQIFDLTVFGPYYPGELQMGLNQYNAMVQQTISMANQLSQADRILNDNDVSNDISVALMIAGNPNIGLRVNGITYWGTDALSYLSARSGGSANFGATASATPALYDGVLQNAFQAQVTVYADGSMSPMSIQYMNYLSGLNGVNGNVINASWDPSSYEYIPNGGVQSNGEWLGKAFSGAGIDPFKWIPAKGYEANKETVRKVYEWYAKMQLEHPELQWAGMAKLAGGSVIKALELIQSMKSAAGLAAFLMDVPLETVNKAFNLMEQVLLSMQQKIFVDLAWQHQAYVGGGIEALRAAFNRGEMDAATFAAWTKIASGDPAKIFEGNKELLYREQFIILRDDYALLSGVPLAPFMMSYFATSMVPGGTDFHDYNSNGNITNFDDRWNWINADLLTRWQSMSPEWRRALVSQPLEQLINEEYAPNPQGPVPSPHPTPTPPPGEEYPAPYQDPYQDPYGGSGYYAY